MKFITMLLLMMILPVTLTLSACGLTRAHRAVSLAPSEEIKHEPPAAAPPILPQIEGEIVDQSGEVQIQTLNGIKQASVENQKVAVSTTVMTGTTGRARIVMPDKNELDLAPDSQLVIERYQSSAEQKSVMLNLIKGKVRARVQEKYDGSNRFIIRTPAAVSGVRGTDFAVSFASGLSKIVTFAGAVEFGLPGPDDSIASPVMVMAGQTSEAKPQAAPAAPRKLSKVELQTAEKDFAILPPPANQEPEAARQQNEPLRWLRNGNIRFVKNRLRRDGQGKNDIARVAQAQHPHAIVMASSDSRVPPEIIFDQKLGEIYVTRSLNFDAAAIASAEFAVTQLKVGLLVVLGQSSLTGDSGWSDPKKLVQELELKSPALKSARENGSLIIQPAAYDLNTGVVTF